MPVPKFTATEADNTDLNPYQSKTGNAYRPGLFPDLTNKPLPSKFLTAQKAVVTALSARMATLEKQARAEAEAAGEEFDPIGFRAKLSDVLSVYLDAITAVAGGSASSIAEIQELVGDLELIEGADDLETADGRTVFGLALMDSNEGPGKIVLNTMLEDDPQQLRGIAIEELAERMYQEISGDFSQGDFGAEVSGRIAGTITGAQIAANRTSAENDVTVVADVGTGEAAAEDEPSTSDVMKNIFSNLMEADPDVMGEVDTETSEAAAAIGIEANNDFGDGTETVIENLGLYGGVFRPNGFLTVFSVRDGEIIEQRIPVDERGIARVTEAEIIESEGAFVDEWDVLSSDNGAFVMFQDGGNAMPDVAFYANSRSGELTHISSENVDEYAEIMNSGLRFWDPEDITIEYSTDYGDGSGDVVEGLGVRAMLTESGVGEMKLRTGGYFYSSDVLTGDDLTAQYEESDALTLRLLRGDATVADFDQIDDDVLSIGIQMETQFRVNVERILTETSKGISFKIPDDAGSVELQNAAQDMLIQGSEMMQSMGVVYGQLSQMIADMQGAGMDESVMNEILTDVTNGSFTTVEELSDHIDQWVAGVEQTKTATIAQITDILPTIIDGEARAAALSQLFMVINMLDTAMAAGTIIADVGKVWMKNKQFKSLLAETKAKSQETLDQDPDFLQKLTELGLTPSTWKTYVQFSKTTPEKLLPSSMTDTQIADAGELAARQKMYGDRYAAIDEQTNAYNAYQTELPDGDPNKGAGIVYTGEALERDVTPEEISAATAAIRANNQPVENPDYWKEMEEYYKAEAKNYDDKEELFSLYSLLKDGISMISSPLVLQTRIIDSQGNPVYVDTNYQPDFATMTQYASETYLNTLPSWEVSGDVALAVSEGATMMQNSYPDYGGVLSENLQPRFEADDRFDLERGEFEAGNIFYDEASTKFGELFEQGIDLDTGHLDSRWDNQNYDPRNPYYTTPEPLTREQHEQAITASIAMKMKMDYEMFQELSNLKSEYGADVLDRYAVTGLVTQSRNDSDYDHLNVPLTEEGKTFITSHVDYIDLEGVSMQLLPVRAEDYRTALDTKRVPRYYLEPGSIMYDVVKDHVDMDKNSPTYGMMLDARAFVPPAWWKEHDNNENYSSGRLGQYFDIETSENMGDFDPLLEESPAFVRPELLN